MTREEFGALVSDAVKAAFASETPRDAVSDILMHYAVEIGRAEHGSEFMMSHLFLYASSIRRQLDEAAADAMLEKTLGTTEH